MNPFMGERERLEVVRTVPLEGTGRGGLHAAWGWMERKGVLGRIKGG